MIPLEVTVSQIEHTFKDYTTGGTNKSVCETLLKRKNGNYPKNFSHKGLTGEQLKQAAKDAYCKKTTTEQNNIKEEHQKLSASSPKKD